MNLPKYLLQKYFLLNSVLFVMGFSVLFLLLYHPFSDTIWLDIHSREKVVPTLLFFAAGGCILLVSKALMLLYQQRHTVTLNKYILWLAGELVVIAALYLLFASRYINPGTLFSAKLLLRTTYCVALILAIPYTIYTLIAANRDKAEEINALRANQTAQQSSVIDFYDFGGALKLSVPADSIFYIASQDNYVEIRYALDGQLLNYLMRCRTTRLEKQLEGTSLVRCHRSYIVNVDNVSLFKRENARVFLVLNHPDAKRIPVSRSYYKTIAERLGRIAS